MNKMDLQGKSWWTGMIIIFIALGTSSTVSRASIHSKKQIGFGEIDDVNVSEDGYHPQVFFEVTRPIDGFSGEDQCSVMVLQHDFGYTYNKPPITVAYTPPPKECIGKWNKAVLEWKATCKGRQFDRIAAVWLSGVEILRTCTAEPTRTGIEWTVDKDITKYSALLKTNQTVVVELGNLVDSTYTGIYHVNITIHFYNNPEWPHDLMPADLILPISNPSPDNGGYWFQIQNSSDVQSRDLQLPSNVYRAVLEVFVSFHMNDESWYANPPNAYIVANNLTNIPGNGPFREVVVLVDGVEVGAVWPFPVIFTGGVNPLLWRPVVAIGAFDLPTYDLEITPFVGKLLCGKDHRFGLRVTNALDVWFVDANLHLWLDDENAMTKGELIRYDVPSYQSNLNSNFTGLDGLFKTYAERQISYSGWVESSRGNLTTQFIQKLKYVNQMSFENSGEVQIVDQNIGIHNEIIVETPSKVIFSTQVSSSFPMYLYFASEDKGNDTSLQTANISMALEQEIFIVSPTGSSFSYLNNTQGAQGYIYVKNNLVTSGLGSTQQTYNFKSTEGCYLRTLSVSNYTVLKDDEELCVGK